MSEPTVDTEEAGPTANQIANRIDLLRNQWPDEHRLAMWTDVIQEALDQRALSASSIPTGWETIDSAPKDGTIILVRKFPEGQPYAAYWGLAVKAFTAGVASANYPWVILDPTNGVNGLANGSNGATHWRQLSASPTPVSVHREGEGAEQQIERISQEQYERVRQRVGRAWSGGEMVMPEWSQVLEEQHRENIRGDVRAILQSAASSSLTAQEPMAWRYRFYERHDGDEMLPTHWTHTGDKAQVERLWTRYGKKERVDIEPLYASPHPVSAEAGEWHEPTSKVFCAALVSSGLLSDQLAFVLREVEALRSGEKKMPYGLSVPVSAERKEAEEPEADPIAGDEILLRATVVEAAGEEGFLLVSVASGNSTDRDHATTIDTHLSQVRRVPSESPEDAYHRGYIAGGLDGFVHAKGR